MNRPARLLEYVIVQLPDNSAVLNHRAQWASLGTHMAHSPIHILGGTRGLAQQMSQQDIPFPTRQHFFAAAWRWLNWVMDRAKRRHRAPPEDLRGQLEMPIQAGLQ